MPEQTAIRLWPEDADPEYVRARSQLVSAERRLKDAIEEVARARRGLGPGTPLPEYVFDEGPRDLAAAEPTTRPTLADLFGPHDTLLTYHLMYAADAAQACPMCSMWVDGWHGVSHHLARHAGLAVIAKAPLPRLRAWGRQRGWHGLRLVSSSGNTFNSDLNMENEGGQRPGVSVFTREGSLVRHWYSAQASFSQDEPERGIDLLCVTWSLLDLLPQGRRDWYASNDYAGAERGERWAQGE